MDNRLFKGEIRDVYAAGDLHGDHESFDKIIKRYKGTAEDSLLLFLGDYADRGAYGVEIIMKLNELLDSRDDIVALKGNHEMYSGRKPDFFPCDLVHEAEDKYVSWKRFYDEIFGPFLSKLYIAAIINNILFVHAGVSSRIKNEDDLIDKRNEKTLVWSDPSPALGEHSDMRGSGMEFGEDITGQVLHCLGVKMMIRSHEPRKAAQGPYAEHGGRVITTNSCASYGEPWKPFLLKVDTKALKYRAIFL